MGRVETVPNKRILILRQLERISPFTMSLQRSRRDCRDQGRSGGGRRRFCDGRRWLREARLLGDGGRVVPVGTEEAVAGVGLGRRLGRHGSDDGRFGGVADVGHA